MHFHPKLISFSLHLIFSSGLFDNRTSFSGIVNELGLGLGLIKVLVQQQGLDNEIGSNVLVLHKYDGIKK